MRKYCIYETLKEFNDTVQLSAMQRRCINAFVFLFERLGENELCRRLKNGEPLLAI